MFELNVKSYIKRNPRQFKRFFSSFTLPKTSALFASFLNTRRVAYSSANYGDASATKLFIFLS